MTSAGERQLLTSWSMTRNWTISGRSLAWQKRQSGGLKTAGSNPAALTTQRRTEGKTARSGDRLERDSRGKHRVRFESFAFLYRQLAQKVER